MATVEVEGVLPQPSRNLILIKNPANEKTAEQMMELEKMPPSVREIHAKNLHQEIWENIEVIAKGPQVIEYEVGDRLILDFSRISSAVYVMGGHYLMFSETCFVGKW